jgi:hypothetical protein
MAQVYGVVTVVHYREKTMSGKGSAPRPFSDRATFDSNWDAIFGKDKQGQGEVQPEVKDDDKGKAEAD